MPLLMMKKVDRQLLYLNEAAYSVYVESADRMGGDPWVRWARNFERCLPLTLWQHFGKPLGHETYARDVRKFNEETRKIHDVLRQGRVVAFPGDEYTTALSAMESTSPSMHSKIREVVQGFSNL